MATYIKSKDQYVKHVNALELTTDIEEARDFESPGAANRALDMITWRYGNATKWYDFFCGAEVVEQSE